MIRLEPFREPGIRSREAPGLARLLSGPRVAAGLAVGRRTTAIRTTVAPDCQTAGDSRPPNAPPPFETNSKVADLSEIAFTYPTTPAQTRHTLRR